MNKSDFENIFIDAVNALRKSRIVPIDTGNLAYNAIKANWASDKQYTIYIDSTVAPYAKYTIEAWKDGTNPNEDWLYRAFMFVARYISKRIGGELG